MLVQVGGEPILHRLCVALLRAHALNRVTEKKRPRASRQRAARENKQSAEESLITTAFSRVVLLHRCKGCYPATSP